MYLFVNALQHIDQSLFFCTHNHMGCHGYIQWCSDKCTCTYNGQSFGLVSLLLVGALSDPDVDSVPDVQNHHVITDQVLLGEVWDLVHREPPRGIGHLEQASWVVRFHFL